MAAGISLRFPMTAERSELRERHLAFSVARSEEDVQQGEERLDEE
jgi:hypothetical protein